MSTGFMDKICRTIKKEIITSNCLSKKDAERIAPEIKPIY